MTDAGQRGVGASIKRWWRNAYAWARNYPNVQPRRPTLSKDPLTAAQRAVVLAAYSELGSRRSNSDTLMWQVPAFIATVEGVLLGFVLKTGRHSTERQVLLLAAAWIALIGWQTMRKHPLLRHRRRRAHGAPREAVGLGGRCGCRDSWPWGRSYGASPWSRPICRTDD